MSEIKDTVLKGGKANSRIESNVTNFSDIRGLWKVHESFAKVFSI